MLTLFPQYRIALGVGWLATAAAAGWMLQSGAAWYWIAALVLVCGFSTLAIAELAAASQHQRLLMILYREGDPDRFIRAYEPLLSQRCTAPGRLLTLRAYLSNAYLAKGEFERAAQLLDEAPEVTGREAGRGAARAAARENGQKEEIGAEIGLFFSPLSSIIGIQQTSWRKRQVIRRMRPTQTPD